MVSVKTNNRYKILNTYVNAVSMDETIETVENIIRERVPTQHVVINASKAFYLIAERGIDGKTYVLSIEKAKQLAKYILDIRDVAAPNASLDFGAIPYSGKQVMYLCADILSLRKDVGFEAQTDFKTGIKSILEGEIYV